MERPLSAVEPRASSSPCRGQAMVETAPPVNNKRARPIDEDHLDNYHSHKRYLTEVMASGMGGLRMSDWGSPQKGGVSLADVLSVGGDSSPLMGRSESAPLSVGEDVLSAADSLMTDDADSDDSSSPRMAVDPGGLTPGFLENGAASPTSPRRRSGPQAPPPLWGGSTHPYTIPRTASALQRLSEPESRLPPSPSDPCTSANLRRAALLRSLQLRQSPPVPGGSSWNAPPPLQSHLPTSGLSAGGSVAVRGASGLGPSSGGDDMGGSDSEGSGGGSRRPPSAQMAAAQLAFRKLTTPVVTPVDEDEPPPPTEKRLTTSFSYPPSISTKHPPPQQQVAGFAAAGPPPQVSPPTQIPGAAFAVPTSFGTTAAASLFPLSGGGGFSSFAAPPLVEDPPRRPPPPGDAFPDTPVSPSFRTDSLPPRPGGGEGFPAPKNVPLKGSSLTAAFNRTYGQSTARRPLHELEQSPGALTNRVVPAGDEAVVTGLGRLRHRRRPCLIIQNSASEDPEEESPSGEAPSSLGGGEEPSPTEGMDLTSPQ